MKKRFYKTVKVEVNDITYLDKSFFIDYYILESRKSTGEKGYERSFGIEAVKRYTDYFGNNVVQEARLSSVTSDEDEIEAFVSYAAKVNVLPDDIDIFCDEYFGSDALCKSAV